MEILWGKVLYPTKYKSESLDTPDPRSISSLFLPGEAVLIGLHLSGVGIDKE